MAATSRAVAPAADRDGDDASNAGGDAGMVTVETAIGLCAFVIVLAMLLAGTDLVIDQIKCIDAAREAARLVAMGRSDSAPAAVGAIAPRGATWSVRQADGDAVTVVVSASPVGGLLPGVRVAADAYAVREPDSDSADDPTGAAR